MMADEILTGNRHDLLRPFDVERCVT